MNSDWIVPDVPAEVRQGDLLMCHDPQSGAVEELCVVITADCDISHGKFGHQLACLRTIPLHDYVRTAWAERKLAKLKKDEAEKLRGQVAKWHTRMLGQESALSTEAVVAWVLRETPEDLCTAIQLSAEEQKKFLQVLRSFRSARSELDAKFSTDHLSQYTAYRAACLARDIPTCRDEVLQTARREPLPEDVFLLPTLPQLEVGAALVMLRQIVSVRAAAVCYKASDANSSDMFLRLGRLQPTLKYALSQSFGSLYSRIGLPDEYEQRCKTVRDSIDYKWE